MGKTTKHTPGPWKQYMHGWQCICQDVPTEDGAIGQGIAQVLQYSEMKESTARANAALMTAAPELLEALEDCARWITANIIAMAITTDGNFEVWLAENKTLQNANAVIKKAKGE